MRLATVLYPSLRMPYTLQKLGSASWLQKRLTDRELTDRDVERDFASRTARVSRLYAELHHTGFTVDMTAGQRERDAELIIGSDADAALKY
mmetsp:Transcript_2069/g.4761  ORF Transcript_2069/g.4761 Transcript_2069/m.4761 type:complete len:91 (+) Transcript_2069:4552-4824(+)